MAPKKQIHLNFFEVTCAGSHMGIGLYRNPGDNAHTKDRLDYYIWLAKLAEKGKITSIFFADTYAVDETYKECYDYSYRGGSLVAQMDPQIFVSAMASVTKSVSFALTGSTSYIPPYILARSWATLDQVTNGRIGWNVVTSYSNTAAKAHGMKSVTPHDQRYVEAEEYMDLLYSLWEGSWEDGAQCFDANKAYDPSKIHKVHFNGKYHSTSAIHQVHPSPQRTPLLFQAGSSPSGKAFAAKHAEAVFCGGGVPSDAAPFVKSVREAAAANGRDPTDIKFFPQMTPILGRTLEEARAKHDRYRACIDWEAGLAKISGFVNFDFAKLPPDEPFIFDDTKNSDNAIHTILKTIKRYDVDGTLTPRKLGEQMAFCGFSPMPVGTPEMVADLMEEWVEGADVDGFNIAYVSNPESYEDLVELLVPVLQERGLMWKDYAVPGGTFRENVRRQKGDNLLPATHPAGGFRYEALVKAGKVDGKGHVVIDRVKEDELAKEAEALKLSEVKVTEQEVEV